MVTEHCLSYIFQAKTFLWDMLFYSDCSKQPSCISYFRKHLNEIQENSLKKMFSKSYLCKYRFTLMFKFFICLMLPHNSLASFPSYKKHILKNSFSKYCFVHNICFQFEIRLSSFLYLFSYQTLNLFKIILLSTYQIVSLG